MGCQKFRRIKSLAEETFFIMKMKRNIAFVIMLLTGICHSYAQHSFFIDTTDKRIKVFRNTINEKENIVKFIEHALKQHSIPVALRNLALIESAFNNKALSVANAAGLWQLTTGHAAFYGISGAERYDVLKSTKVAIETITELYKRYGDWRIVIAAYNCGEGNVNKAILKAHSASYDEFSVYLPAETRLHVYKFILACYATGELRLMNFPAPGYYDTAVKITSQSIIKYNEPVTAIAISGGFALTVIGERLAMPVEMIRSLNPEFDSELSKTGTTKLVLPVDKMPDFLLQKNEILIASLN